ncbi:MAG: hypothetical protein H6865_00135 [Rhodospirillales bacterium]|nr:hypothetical protein [Alphaproteobacteria bacterium]MCB9986033.1 hypothetical protein [Rhodospirillales bacterium]USO07394.1 MAG: hypothetical protein H6866_08235 [Rhodospirillales bacterium]
MAYSDIGHDFTEGGTPICVFRNPNETPTAYHAQSFATSNGGTLIVHDAASLRRFLSEHRYIRFLAPSAYVRWNHAYTELARRPRHDTKAAPALRVAA